MPLLDIPCVPDFTGLKTCLLRKGTPARVYLMEFAIDDGLMEAIVERYGLADSLDRGSLFYSLQREVAVRRFLGYDVVVPGEIALPFPMERGAVSAEASSDIVAVGPIGSWEDFDAYPWPDPRALDLRGLEWLEANLPDTMQCCCLAPVGLYKMLVGYESMYYLLFDAPDLLRAVIEKLTEIFTEFCRIVCQFPCVAAIWGSDDMGHKTQTFFPPEYVREIILPLHRACAEVAHARGRLYLLHACGNLEVIMDDLIHDVKIDAKHSFEDAIMPIETVKQRYGQELALLGGVDVDFLCRATEPALRRRVRQILDACQPGGGYCLGSGNSIASYVPLENFLIMLDEGRRWRR